MILYIVAIIILLLILFIYCHITKLKQISNNFEILQVANPTPDIAYELFEQRQAIVFQGELFFWKEFNALVGQPLTNIKTEIASNKHINYSDYIKNNIEIYNLPLAYDWDIDIRNIILNEKSAIFFIKQLNYLQLFGCVSGEMRVILVAPNNDVILEPFTNMISTIDATPILNKEPMELNYIEIIIREGNMIYIPYKWMYFIYNASIITECVIVDCINKSVLGLI